MGRNQYKIIYKRKVVDSLQGVVKMKQHFWAVFLTSKIKPKRKIKVTFELLILKKNHLQKLKCLYHLALRLKLLKLSRVVI